MCMELHALSVQNFILSLSLKPDTHALHKSGTFQLRLIRFMVFRKDKRHGFTPDHLKMYCASLFFEPA